MLHFQKTALLIMAASLLGGCVSSLFGDRLVLRPVEFDQLPGWDGDRHDEALESFLKSCQKFSTLPKDRPLYSGGLGGTVGDWEKVCEEGLFTLYKGQEAAQGFFEAYFEPYAATNWGKPEGLFTGYFEAGLKGSRTKGGPYIYPLYKKPSDIEDGKAYFSHKKINQGALEGKDLELLWVSDPVQRFFLHIQGSGQVELEDGSIVRVGYDGKNNHDYQSIGRHMIDKGWIDEENISAQTIKEWFYHNPERMWDVIEQNPSYVFFKELQGTGGPVGAQGVSLMPLRSLAVDKTKVPYGVPMWLDVELTGEERPEKKKFQRLVIAQDTGSAIKGAVRGDIFFGAGKQAEELAGYQNNKGRYYMLLPKNVRP